MVREAVILLRQGVRPERFEPINGRRLGYGIPDLEAPVKRHTA
jgi:hypothetical protein